MPLLSSSIVKNKLATVQEVEEALARQSVYGGDLLTNLVEITRPGEDQIAAALSESYGLPAAPPGVLPQASERVRRLIPRDIVQRFACYPLEETGGVLSIAVTEPLPIEVESDMAFALGLSIELRIASLLRVRQAAARDYAVPLERRLERALARLEGRSDPYPSIVPPRYQPPPVPAVQKVVEEKPAAREQVQFESRLPEPPPAVTKTERVPEMPQKPVKAPDLSALSRREGRERQRRIGPYTAAMAERDLQESKSADRVLEVFFDFASQYFEYAALFAIHEDLAEGRDAHGPGASRDRVRSIGVPLDLPSSLASAATGAGHTLVRLASGGLDGGLAKDLERRPGVVALFLPIRVKDRAVLVLYGDHGDADLQLDAVGDVISFAPLVSSTLERVIRQKKRGAKGGAAEVPIPTRERRARHSLPSPEQRAQALVTMLGTPQKSRAVTSAPAPAVATTAPAPAPEPAPAADPARHAEPTHPPVQATPRMPETASLPPEAPPPPQRPSLARPVLSVGLGSVAPAKVERVVAPESLTPIAEVRSKTPLTFSAAPMPPRRANSIPPAAVDAAWDELSRSEPPPFGGHERGTRPGVGPRGAREADSPDVAVGVETDEELGAELVSADESPPTGGGAPLAPASWTDGHTARPLQAQGSSAELGLPTVIVDVTNDCRSLVEQLLRGDASASDRLVAAGSPAITVLVAAFPGPIEAPSSRRTGGALPRASECGPVLRTLARFGVKAAPFLVVRTNDADPHVRAWATRLLGELPSVEGALAIARRFFDADADVRRAALAGARFLSGAPDSQSIVVSELGATAEDRARPNSQRLIAIEMLAELRHPQAVSALVRTLENNPQEIVSAARAALVTITRQDFGEVGSDWLAFYRANSSRHRIEWLIDALTHESAEIRRAAGEELKTLTREYFGYYDDLPPGQRAHAQEKYREWWEARGKARFR
jgi:HEAT repeat protein